MGPPHEWLMSPHERVTMRTHHSQASARGPSSPRRGSPRPRPSPSRLPGSRCGAHSLSTFCRARSTRRARARRPTPASAPTLAATRRPRPQGCARPALEVRAASRTAAGAAAVETEPDGEGGGPSPTPGPTPARQPLHFRLKACTITRTPQHPSLHKYLPPHCEIERRALTLASTDGCILTAPPQLFDSHTPL